MDLGCCNIGVWQSRFILHVEHYIIWAVLGGKYGEDSCSQWTLRVRISLLGVSNRFNSFTRGGRPIYLIFGLTPHHPYPMCIPSVYLASFKCIKKIAHLLLLPDAHQEQQGCSSSIEKTLKLDSSSSWTALFFFKRMTGFLLGVSNEWLAFYWGFFSCAFSNDRNEQRN